MRRMFLAMLSTETNTFSPIPTGLNVWRDMLLVRRSDPPDEDPQWPFVDQPLED